MTQRSFLETLMDSSAPLSPMKDLLPPKVLTEDRLSWTFPMAIISAFDIPRPEDFRQRLETGVKNGDCLPACFAVMLECMHQGHVSSQELETAAAKIRSELIEWIKLHWLDYPIFSPEMPVHELMWMTHDMGITAQERRVCGEWGDNPTDRLKAYMEQSHRIYFSDTEMLLFSCMMYEKRKLPILFRTWRSTGTGASSGSFISCTPSEEVMRLNSINEAVVVDLHHSGRVDAASAHYKVLDSGGLRGLTEVRLPPKKRRLFKGSELTEDERRFYAQPPELRKQSRLI